MDSVLTAIATAPAVSKPLSARKEKILLVDDDCAIRRVLGQLLSDEGYTAIPAATEFDLVLLDLNLPEKNGWDTFEQINSRRPLLPIIVIAARNNQLFPALASGVGALMEKPLHFPKLFRAIRDLLDEPAAARQARITAKSASFPHFPASEKNHKKH